MLLCWTIFVNAYSLGVVYQRYYVNGPTSFAMNTFNGEQYITRSIKTVLYDCL